MPRQVKAIVLFKEIKKIGESIKMQKIGKSAEKY